MKCPHCDFERPEAFAFCPKCGKPSTHDAAPEAVCPTPRILSFIKDDLFFIACILLTAASGIALLSGNINVIEILITVFAWLTYAGGRKNTVSSQHIKVISGSYYALYIIKNILAILFIVLGLLYTAAILLLPLFSSINLPEMIAKGFALSTDELGPMVLFSNLIIGFISTFAVVLGIILIVIGIAVLIINIAGRKKIHRLIQSIYKSVENGEENLAAPKKAGTWLIVFAVLNILSAVTALSNGDLLLLLSEGIMSAALIIFNTLINKHFCNK